MELLKIVSKIGQNFIFLFILIFLKIEIPLISLGRIKHITYLYHGVYDHTNGFSDQIEMEPDDVVPEPLTVNQVTGAQGVVSSPHEEQDDPVLPQRYFQGDMLRQAQSIFMMISGLFISVFSFLVLYCGDMVRYG